MARARSPFAGDVEKLCNEIKAHRKELSGMDREVAGHQKAIAQIGIRRQYLNDLIQAQERMITRYTKLAGVRPPARRGRPVGRPAKVKKPVQKGKRRRVRRAAAPTPVRVISQRFAALSVTDAAEQVLKRTRKPVHLREITSELIAGGKAFRTKKPEVSVLTMISKDKRFRNTGRNMWTLA